MKKAKQEDKCKRRPVRSEKVPYYISEALYILKKTNRITPFEFFITYCYLFNGISLKMLRDRVLKLTSDGFEFASKQHIHQNIISKVTGKMKNEIDRIKAAELKSERKRNNNEETI